MLLKAIGNWASLQRSQWFTRERLEQLQVQKLKEMVQHASAQVPFYRKLYDRKAIQSANIIDVRSIERLPFITKEDLRNTPLEQRTAANIDIRQCIRLTTSGSTGMPLVTLESPESAAYRAALWIRRLWAAGLRPQHKGLVCIPATGARTRFTNPAGLWRFILGKRVRWIPFSAEMRDHVALVSNWKPDLVLGPASYFRYLVRAAEEMRTSLAFKVAYNVGEMMDGLTRKMIAEKLGAEVYSTYGTLETSALSWECPAHSGQHINAESSIVELIRDGEPVGPGETGEVCVTSLFRKENPIIRYLVGDVATFADDDCSCERGLPLIKEIQGRSLDFILTKDGKRISPFTIMYALENVEGIRQFKVKQGSDYSVTLLVELSKTEDETTRTIVGGRCLDLFGDLAVRVEIVEKIEIPKGSKFRIVESEVAR